LDAYSPTALALMSRTWCPRPNCPAPSTPLGLPVMCAYTQLGSQVSNETSLHKACVSGHLAVVKLLLGAGACTQAKTEGGEQTDGCTPLQMAVFGQQGNPNPHALAISKLLIKEGAELEAVDADGDTVLGTAVI
jgi:ankyrin repeat protein